MNKNKIYDIIVKIFKSCAKVYNMVFNTRIKKVVNLSVVGFVCGVGVVLGTFAILNNFNKKHSVGGFETQSPLSHSLQIASGIEAETQIIDENNLVLTYKTYRVKPGDMIGHIAEANNISQDTLISVNNIKQTRLIQPGQYLKIPSIPGVLYTVKKDNESLDDIVKKYEISLEKCVAVNNFSENVSLKQGDTIFLPDALLDWVTRQEINGDLFKKPLHRSYYISSRYGWRDSPFNTGKRSFHGGTDMAAPSGTPIYAALAGTVELVKYGDPTYGNYVILKHHSGYKTLYAHMSEITCKKGNVVFDNTMIGRVGSTGMSTGPHLHFTVYKNGKSINPMTVLN